MGFDTANTVCRKYGVTMEIECVENLPLPSGTEVCFVIKRPDKVAVSHAAEIWEEGGVAYWDAKCSQVCTLAKTVGNAVWTSKPTQIEVQTVNNCQPGQESCALADAIAYAELDIAPYCVTDKDGPEAAEPTPPQQIVVSLKPQGAMIAHISTQWIRDCDAELDDEHQACAAATLTEPLSCASFSDEASAPVRLSLAEAQSSPVSLPARASDAPPPLEIPHYCASPPLHLQEGAASCRLGLLEPMEASAEPPASASTSKIVVNDTVPFKMAPSIDPQVVDVVARMDRIFVSTPASSVTSSSLQPSQSSGSTGGVALATASALQRRCRRLEKQREEARAESFAQASAAVQRGIEIENLKRAKEMLLQRLETAERQLMGLVRLDVDDLGRGRADSTDDASGEDCSHASSKSDPDGIVDALVDAKLRLAEQEFQIMELQGKLRARDAHIETLTEQLQATRGIAGGSESIGMGLWTWATPRATPKHVQAIDCASPLGAAASQTWSIGAVDSQSTTKDDDSKALASRIVHVRAEAQRSRGGL